MDITKYKALSIQQGWIMPTQEKQNRMDKDQYVLATKYRDGDPCDEYAVGFYDKEKDGRHYVVDNDGKQFRGNGFRRVAKISDARGRFLIKNIENIDAGGRSLWWWNRKRMT